jgi:hypothetical protein
VTFANIAGKAVAVAFSALTACGTARPATVAPLTGADGQPVPVGAVVDERTGQIVLPLDALLPSPSQQHVIDYAADLVRARCLRAAGQLQPVVDRRDDPPTVSRRYGVWAASHVETYGYAPPPKPPGARRQEQLRHLPITPARKSVIQACRQDAALRRLALDNVGSQASALDIYDATLASPEGAAALRDWRVCLREQGVTDRPDPDNPFMPAGATLDPTPANIAIAKVDVACKMRTDLVRRLADLEARRQWEEVLRRQPDAARRQVAALQAVLRNAAAVIDTEGT